MPTNITEVLFAHRTDRRHFLDEASDAHWTAAEYDTMETSTIFLGNAKVVDKVDQGLYDDAILSAKLTLERLIPKLYSSSVPASESETVDSFVAWRDLQLRAWDDEEVSCADFPICMKAFHVETIGEISEASLRLMSVTLLYNMALSFHLKGVATADQRFSNLQKALNIYTKTLEVMSERRHELGPRERILELAINNNMGNIYSYVGYTKHVLSCLDRIRELLIFSAYLSELVQIECEIMHFKLNVFLFESVLPNKHSPAA